MDVFAALKAAFIGIALLGGVLLSIFAPRRYHDSKIEEAAEKVIEVMTGHDVDLTPNSPEPEDCGLKTTTFIETITADEEDVFEDNWDEYFDGDILKIIESVESFPID